MQYSQEHLKTMVYAKFGGQTECIMGNWKIENTRMLQIIPPFIQWTGRGPIRTWLISTEPCVNYAYTINIIYRFSQG